MKLFSLEINKKHNLKISQIHLLYFTNLGVNILDSYKMSSTIVQYVLLRSDLLNELGWSIGALVAQACHASTAVLHLFKDDAHTIQYLNDLDNMHKVVLEVPNEESLKKVANKLQENSISHKLWIEQPENIPTCLAIKPYPKEDVKKFVGKFKLYKATLKD